MLINVKMPTVVGILTFISRINFVLSSAEHGKVLKPQGLTAPFGLYILNRYVKKIVFLLCLHKKCIRNYPLALAYKYMVSKFIGLHNLLERPLMLRYLV